MCQKDGWELRVELGRAINFSLVMTLGFLRQQKHETSNVSTCKSSAYFVSEFGETTKWQGQHDFLWKHGACGTAIYDPGVNVGHSVFQHAGELIVTHSSQQEASFQKIRTFSSISSTLLLQILFLFF